MSVLTRHALPIAISMGDPAGIGPEVILKAAAAWRGKAAGRRLLVVGDLRVMRAVAGSLGKAVPKPRAWDDGRVLDDDTLAVLESSRLGIRSLRPGHPTVPGADAAYRYVETGARMALEGKAAALVTAPISKEWLNRAGHRFPGHSELLAELAGVRRWCMMFATRRLRLALVTVHMGLARVARALSIGKIVDTIELLAAHLRADGGVANPRLAVLGFNPHAGENGLFGREEIDIVAPAIAIARGRGIDAFGPVPPDTAFIRSGGRFAFDGAVAMYHDQGLIPIKTLDFDNAVNVTLGLPFLRTSPDHGTAYDIAGQGRAREQSMRAAITFALRATSRR